MNQPPPPPRGWILYDDSCGICRRGVSLWERALRKRGFVVAPLQAEWVAGRLGIAPERLLDDLRLLLADGTRLDGAAAYRHAMRCIWWAWPAYLASLLPGGRQLFDWCYRTVARHRYRKR